jgi:membrane-associated phospholipid phosphatase
MTDDPLPHAEGADAPGQLPEAVRHPPWLLGALAAIALAALVVVLAGWTIARGHVFAFDRAILLAMREGGNAAPIGPPRLARAMVDITALGSGTVLMLAVVLTLGFLALHRLWLTASLVLAATLSGSIAVGLAKYVVARPRPAVIDHLVHVSSASFPSGHSANSAIVYLTLATLLVQVVRGRAQRNFILIAAALLVIAIGCSRVYLGVHWPSDVIAGWSFGALWALGWWALGAWIRLRRSQPG